MSVYGNILIMLFVIRIYNDTVFSYPISIVDFLSNGS